MWCSKCGGTDHYAKQCPATPTTYFQTVVKPPKEPKQHAPKAKKPWVKPTLTRWVKADSMDTSPKPMDTKSSAMDTHGYKYRDKENRKEQMRDYMRKKRARECPISAS